MTIRTRIAEARKVRSSLLAKANKIVAEESVEELAEEVSTELDEILSEIAKLDERISKLEKLAEKEEETETVEARVAPSISAKATARPKSHDAERSAFRAYLRTGQITNTAVSTGTAGMMIPTYVADSVMQEVAKSSFMRSLATVKTIPGNTKVPVISGVGNFGVVPEGGNYPELSVTVGGPSLEPIKVGGTVPMSYEILNLAGYDVEAEISTAIADGLAEAEEELFLIGNGTTEPQGVFPGAASKVTAASPTTVTAAEVLKLYYGITQRYRARGTWIMHPNTAALLRTLEDTAGNPIWQPAGLVDATERLLGAPVYTSEYAPELGAGKRAIVFGDLSKFIIGDRLEKWILPQRELYSNQGQIGLQITSFLDSGVAVPAAIGCITMKAS